MDLISIVIALLLLGLAFYVVRRIPFDPQSQWIRDVIYVVLVVFFIIWLLNGLGGIALYHPFVRR
jgi:hypothetical protein